MKIYRILAGIDLGSDTEIVLSYASFFAKETGASLKLLYVIDYLVTPPAYLAPYMKEEKRGAEEKLVLWANRLRDSGIKTETEVIVGRLRESFESAVERLKADLLVLGFRSHPLRRSSSERLIKGLRMPMLVTRGEKASASRIGSVKIKKILCPTDFSDTSKKALEVAGKLRDIFSSELYVVHVLPSHVIKGKMATWMNKDEAMRDLLEEAKGKLEEFLRDSQIKEKGIISEGDPHKNIVSFSSEKDIDLIIMGSRGLGLIKETILGSVTDALLKSSICPVLIIH
ncbi:MAG: universal stress protein [Nitrospirota bacterium]